MTTADAVRVTVLADNWIDMLVRERGDMIRRQGLVEHFHPDRPRVQAEFGISFLIEVRAGQHMSRVIFDAGLTDSVLLHNLETLRVDPSSVDHVAISHGHPDHYGGLFGLLGAIGHPVPVATHPDAFLPRYALMPDGRTSAYYNRDFLQEHVERAGGRVVLSRDPVELAPGVITSGEIPRDVEFEGPRQPDSFHGPGLYQVKDGTFGFDEVWDELGLVVDVRDAGLIVLTGCGHAGVLNTVRAAQAITGQQRVLLLAGGFHLGFPTTPEANIEKTVSVLKEISPELIMPMHCTGLPAIAQFRSRLADAFVQPAVGTILTMGRW